MGLERGGERVVAGETGPFSNDLYVDVAEHVTVLGRPAVLVHVDDDAIQAGGNDLWGRCSIPFRPRHPALSGKNAGGGGARSGS